MKVVMAVVTSHGTQDIMIESLSESTSPDEDVSKGKSSLKYLINDTE